MIANTALTSGVTKNHSKTDSTATNNNNTIRNNNKNEARETSLSLKFTAHLHNNKNEHKCKKRKKNETAKYKNIHYNANFFVVEQKYARRYHCLATIFRSPIYSEINSRDRENNVTRGS